MVGRYLAIAVLWVVVAGANEPPRFELTDDIIGGEIVLKLKEGSEGTPVGSTIYRIRAVDPDGDVLQFGLLGQAANELLRVQPVSSSEADLVLIKELDREVKKTHSPICHIALKNDPFSQTEEEYSLVLTVTDGKIGAGQAIKQSLLIVVEVL